MQIHNISPKTKPKKGRYIGHGGKKGTYCGRGIKGQRSRTGARIRPQIRDLIKKVPKMRGYDWTLMRSKKKTILINLDLLEKHFSDNEIVNKDTLFKKGLLKDIRSPVKILNKGNLSKILKIEKIPASKKAIDLITKLGGKYDN